MIEYAADFETNNCIDDCRVWAWAVCEVGNIDNVTFGNDIASFISFCETNGGIYHFHNLAFDGEFIIWWLFNNGFEYSEKYRSETFRTLISNTGKFYQLEIIFEKVGRKTKKAVMRDSLKKLPMSVEAIGRAFNTPVQKTSIDYDLIRPLNHRLTDEERDYLKGDVQIVAYALEQQKKQGLKKLTVGSDALNNFKEHFDRWAFLFPQIKHSADKEIRKAYRGGWTYANPKYQANIDLDLTVGAGSVYDVNSLYPYVMLNCPLPVGYPHFFEGQYNGQYPLWIQFFSAHCKLKPDHLPMLQIKKNPYFMESEYLTDTEGIVELAMTNIDIDLLNDHYNVTIFKYHGGFAFDSMVGLFDDYIGYWNSVKESSVGGQRTIAKLMMNSLYGKFATNPDVTGKVPYLKDDNTVGYREGKQEIRDPVYTPMGVFITAHARNKTIRTAQSVYDRFLYADTDSIHVLGCEPIEGIDIHSTHIGSWNHEADFTKAKYIRAKTYAEMINGKLEIKCAGLPHKLKEGITLETFRRGMRVHGKLRPRHVVGGIVLEKTDFTLK